ncbi:MAG TPA: type 4a pilus biogenesis protein PilO [Thermodesulfovibrionales bacterium]|nr:type 4a pilus biogenesis protein PilO [Thermodesulfovibrionales bacterium]
MAEKIDIKTLPKYVKTIISVLPAVIIIIVVTFVILLPKNKEIKALENKILLQENEIAKSRAKAEKLPQLIAENQRLMRRLEELTLQLPEEKEVSSLLKQVSDLGIRSGLHIMLWKPEQKKTHPSGIVYVIPVRVDLSGNYHSLGYFFSSLTKLDRIVNISEIKLSDPKPARDIASLKVSFTATTFSSIPEEETTKKPDGGK